MIEAAKVYEAHQASGKPYRRKNPFGKPWGLQTDGDLWEQAWIAVLKRGAQNQRLRKVKGHATDADVAAGRASQQDKEGNDKADDNADKGVESIQGPGLVELAGWAARRHEAYKKLIMRVQKLIAGTVTAEKEERDKNRKAAKVVLGYDPEKWIKSNGTIRDENKEATIYN